MNIGLIAGGGQFPVLFSRKAREKGFTVIAAAIKNEADTLLNEYTSQIQWSHIGQVAKLIKFFKSNGVTRTVMLGTINKTSIFKDIKPDFMALKLMTRARKTHDDHMLKHVARFLGEQGIEVVASTFLLPELICSKGIWTRKKPDFQTFQDIYRGWAITKEIGKLDIGQCLVMGGGSVLAVEGADGTDETIKRGGLLANGRGAIVIKLSKPNQDLRFDLPTAGLRTIETMSRYGASTLVLEAGKTICFDRDEMIEFADTKKISIVVLDQDDIP
ncbi:MAG: LpxI family protein [Desulfobacteraceae bacterium]|nr:MAG: LpxI family protein [Desulfobacteraceae bacterium]